MAVILSTTILRLVVAAVLGGFIGLQREWRHKPAGLRTNMFICFGAALFTVLSSQLAGSPAEYTRIASTIVTGIGFIGAGSILHNRASVTGLTSAATIFVSAAVGMAAGGGLYFTAIFATIVILISLAALGKLESYFETKSMRFTYETTGLSTDVILNELNGILDASNLVMQDVHSASLVGHSRVVFTVVCEPAEQKPLNMRLHESSIFAQVLLLDSNHRHE